MWKNAEWNENLRNASERKNGKVIFIHVLSLG
jgi:hypothetical protein